MAKFSYLLVVAAALLALQIQAVGRNGAASPPLLLGFTLTHTQVHCDQIRAPGQPRKAAGVDAAHNIVLNYDQTAIRAQTRAILAGMIAEGARLIRTALWFRDITNDTKPSGADVLGLLHAYEGRLPDGKIANLVAYASDVRAAGYRELVLIPGPMIKASPKCGMLQFGDCFDASSLMRSWSLIAQIKRAVQPLSDPNFRILLDLGSEMCPERSRQPIGTTMAEYSEYMISQYTRTFHDDGFIVSCGGGVSAAQGLTRLQALVSLYERLHIAPAALDLHMYFEVPADYDLALMGAEAEADRLKTDLFVLETYIDNVPMFDAVRRLRGAGKLERLRALAVWPLRRNGGCQLSQNAPFKLELPGALGR